MIKQNVLRNLWDRFMTSHGFLRLHRSKKSHYMESSFSVVVVDLDYSPLMREYSPMCSIYLRDLGETPLNPDFLKLSLETYNYMYFATNNIIKQCTPEAIVGITGKSGEYCEEEFHVMLVQNETYALPTLKQCLDESGFLEFYKKYSPQNFGLVCKDLRDWVNHLSLSNGCPQPGK